VVRLLRELRSATRNYVATLEACLAVLDDDLVRTDPELQTIRTALRVASGARSTGAGYAFGTAINLERLLSEALTQAQELVDGMHNLHGDASRPGPGTRSVKRSVLGAGASAASPAHLMAEGGT